MREGGRGGGKEGGREGGGGRKSVGIKGRAIIRGTGERN